MESNLITRIEKQSSYSRRYLIFVDGEFLFSVHEDVLVKYNLHKGMPIDQAKIQDLLQAEELNQVRQAILRYLIYKPRTEWEVKQYLAGKEFKAEIGEQVIAEMKQLGYIDDRKYAKAWVEQRQSSKRLGQFRLRRELQKKGISTTWIEEALADTDQQEERQLAMEIAERRYLRICDEPWPKVERKLGQYLLRQGYTPDLIYSILNVFRSRRAEEEEK